jgi:hypothetical protein
MAYKIVLARRAIAIQASVGSGKPSSTVPFITREGFANFMAASMSMNRITSVLNARPIQIVLFEGLADMGEVGLVDAQTGY